MGIHGKYVSFFSMVLFMITNKYKISISKILKQFISIVPFMITNFQKWVYKRMGVFFLLET